MAAVASTLIELDDLGVAWISATKTKVIEVALDKIAYGWSPRRFTCNTPTGHLRKDCLL